MTTTEPCSHYLTLFVFCSDLPPYPAAFRVDNLNVPVQIKTNKVQTSKFWSCKRGVVVESFLKLFKHPQMCRKASLQCSTYERCIGSIKPWQELEQQQGQTLTLEGLTMHLSGPHSKPQGASTSRGVSEKPSPHPPTHPNMNHTHARSVCTLYCHWLQIC